MAQVQTTSYTMEAFIEDVRNVFRTETDPHVQAKMVSGFMKTLLAVPGWLEEKLELEEQGGYGRYSLHLLSLIHISEPTRQRQAREPASA